METKIKKTVIIPELAHLIPFENGGTWNSLWELFYFTRLFKYVHKKQYNKIRGHFFKISTKEKLNELCEREYLFSPRNNVYCAKNKVLPILEETGFLVNVLPGEPKGKGDINELNNTEVFIKIFKELDKKTFYTFLYPNFIYLIPDALLVELDKENRKYKLTFIEVEALKPDWDNYLISKKANYLRLAKDIRFYEQWCRYCELLKLPKPDLNVKFNYKIYKISENL